VRPRTADRSHIARGILLKNCWASPLGGNGAWAITSRDRSRPRADNLRGKAISCNFFSLYRSGLPGAIDSMFHVDGTPGAGNKTRSGETSDDPTRACGIGGQAIANFFFNLRSLTAEEILGCLYRSDLDGKHGVLVL
jgi:hypothetical protein